MNVFKELTNVLMTVENYVSNDGQLLKNKIYEDAMNLDEQLISKLLDNEKLKKLFFRQIGSSYVFDKVEFGWFMNNKEFLPDSYTKYKNKIGLIDQKQEFISSNNDVVLSFPFKECILVGGQDKNDAKRKEKFYNSVLAPNEVDTLLAPKVLTNLKKYGENNTIDFSQNENLVIKGNNLLSISSLLKKFEGKIKLIYIDPPYNTASDTFEYNDRFNRSTWLTFMKNRLEIAKRLLREDGAIYVQLDYNEVHYAKVLLDEIFGEENFQREIIWRIGWVSGYKTSVNNYIRNHDTILFYSKNKSTMDFKKNYIQNENYCTKIKDDVLFKKLKEYGIDKKQNKEIANYINHEIRPEKYPIEDVWNCNEYDDLNSIAIVSFSGETVSKMLGVEEVKGQKSEALIKRIIESHTNEGDYVLDFFGGTGTTGAVAHKMKRHYIICEQMDYVKSTTVERLNKVIEGEQSGISKSVNWSGGGSFVYCELAELNQKYIDKINESSNLSDLISIWKEIKESAFINYKVDINKIDSTLDEFMELSMEEQKKLLIEILDKNMLYINYYDIDDENNNLSDETKEMNKSFYEGE